MAAKGGYVYAIVNDAMPGLVKLGATTRDPMERLHEARACTWAPPSFRLIAAAATDDAFGTERAVHALLAHRRVDARREFFAMTHEEASALLALVAAIAVPSPAAAQSPAAVLLPLASRNCVLPLGAQQVHGSLIHQAVAQTPEAKLRTWVEEHYEHVPLREKDSGLRLEALYTAYTNAQPPVHAKLLGRNTFGKMLNSVYPNIGPHKNSSSTVFLYLLR
jgi:hypothetical protein